MKIRTTAASILMIGTIIGGISLSTNANEKPPTLKTKKPEKSYSSPYAPILSMTLPTMVNKNNPCGQKSVVIADASVTYPLVGNIIENRLKLGRNLYTFWGNDFFDNKESGIYRFWNGQGNLNNEFEERLQTVALGYKALWINKAQSTTYYGGNTIQSNPTITSGAVTAKTQNLYRPNQNSWFAFKLNQPTVAGGITASQVASDYYTLSVENGNEGGLYIRVSTTFDPNQIVLGGTPLGKVTYHISVDRKSGVGNSFTSYGVTTTDKPGYILVEETGNGIFSVSLNGNTFVPSANIGAITGLNKLHFRAHTRTGFEIGPADVILSSPCQQYAYLDLKRKPDASFYPARMDYVRFRYIEEYSTNSSQLEYTIFNAKNQDVFVMNSVAKPILARQVGDNKCEIDLSPHRSILPAGDYILRVVNDKEEVRFLRFRLY